MESLPEDSPRRPDAWDLVRDVAVLQIKLVVDGIRDLLLVPAAFIAGLISLAKTRDGQPGSEFYRLVSIGKRSEHWINLFGALRNAPPDVVEQEGFGTTDIDDIVSRVESFVIDEYRRGGVTAQARERMEKAVDALRRRASRSPPG